MDLSSEELQFIEEARRFLDRPSFLIRLANLVGKPLETGFKVIPETARLRIHASVEKAMSRGLQVVTRTVARDEDLSFSEATAKARRSGILHSAATFGTGALGGFFGVLSLPVELPVTTAIMLRSIVAIAKDFGHDVSSKEGQLECLYVLSIGGVSESSYFASRLAMNDLLRQAARELGGSSAPYLVRFMAQIASRFEVVVSEKALAELMPVVGALGGGTINAAFSEHFNQAARYHFGLRALESKHGIETIRAVYEGTRAGSGTRA
jgi:hypothetical protein